jgi:hypothetical protein
MENLNWLLGNKFSYDDDIFKIAFDKENLQIMKWIIDNELNVDLNIEIPYSYFSDLNSRKQK